MAMLNREPPSAEAQAIIALVHALEESNPGLTERLRGKLVETGRRRITSPTTQALMRIANEL